MPEAYYLLNFCLTADGYRQIAAMLESEHHWFEQNKANAGIMHAKTLRPAVMHHGVNLTGGCAEGSAVAWRQTQIHRVGNRQTPGCIILTMLVGPDPRD